MKTTLVLFASSLLAIACSSTPTISDAGQQIDAGPHVDAGLSIHAGTTDAGLVDAGATDAGTIDAGSLDAGTTDAGSFDAGTIDAGTIDAGTIDAGTIDAGSLDAGATDAGRAISNDGGINCSETGTYSFPTFDRACSTASDCAIGIHQVNCCGTLDATGIASTASASFAAAEATCDAMYPGCGCAEEPTMTDDGGTVPAGSGASGIVVECVMGVCTTSVRPPGACGSATCSSTQVCLTPCEGVLPPGGTGPSPVCVDVPSACAGGNASCGCVDGGYCPTGTCQSISNGVPTCLCE